MLNIKISYLGHKESGKTSLIKYVFENMRPIDTKNIPPTEKIQVYEYQSGFVHITNTEFSGDFLDFEGLNNDEMEIIK